MLPFQHLFQNTGNRWLSPCFMTVTTWCEVSSVFEFDTCKGTALCCNTSSISWRYLGMVRDTSSEQFLRLWWPYSIVTVKEKNVQSLLWKILCLRPVIHLYCLAAHSWKLTVKKKELPVSPLLLNWIDQSTIQVHDPILLARAQSCRKTGFFSG